MKGVLENQKLIVKAALTGMIPMKEDTPNVPITPKEIAEDAYRVYKHGASVVHVHARDENGFPTHKAVVFREIFERIKEKCPDIIICATT
ncbi:3-keto-5-aminohexanoate cleavage protein, partial [Thermoplasmatales archaeon ex4484_6]